MALAPLCTRAACYALGGGQRAFARPSRLVESVDAAAGALVLRAHGLEDDDPIELTAESVATIGAAAASAPGGTSLGTTYYADRRSSDRIGLRLTPGGSPIASFTDAGAGKIGIREDHGVKLDKAIADATELVAAHATASGRPVSADVLGGITARLAVRIYFDGSKEATRYIDERLLSSMLSGRPIPGATDATPSVVENGAVVVTLAGGGWRDEGDEYRV